VQLELMRSVEVEMSEVQTKSTIGSGSFSLVYKGYYANSHVAIKVLKKVDEKNFRRFLDEIVLHKDLRHPNIIPFRGASWSDGRLLLLIDVSGPHGLSP
jgi:serine/threonine protein kinase